MTNRAGGSPGYRPAPASAALHAHGADPAVHRTRDFLTGTGDAAFLLSAKAEICGWNTAAERLFGLRRAEALGRSCHAVLACRDLRGHPTCAAHCPLLQAIGRGRPSAAVEFLAQHRSGQRIEVSGSALLLPSPDGAQAMVLLRPCPSGIVDSPLELSTPPTGEPSVAGADRRPPWPDLGGSLDRLLIATGADAAELFLVAPIGGELVLAAHRGRAARAFRQIMQFDRGRGFPGLVAQAGEPLLSLDLLHDDRYLRTMVKRQGFRFYLCVPIWGSSGFLGSLHIASRCRAETVGPQLPFLLHVSRELGTTLELHRLRAAGLLADAVILPTLDADSNLRWVAERALQTLIGTANADHGMLLLADDVSAALEPVSECAMSPRLHRALARLCNATTCPAIARRRPVLLSNRGPAESPLCRAVQRELATTLCLPLEIEGNPFGVALLGYRHRESLPTRHLSFLHALITRVALMVHHAQVALRTAHEARVDLTSHPAGLASDLPAPEAGIGIAGAAASGRSALKVPFLDLRCFGQFTVLRDGRPVPLARFARRRSLTLLKILLTHYGKPVHREELIDLLWPDADLRSADDLLNVVVHYLRRGLEPEAPAGQPSLFIRTSGDYYAFDTASPHRLDSQEFLDLLPAEAELETRGRQVEALQVCQRAIALYVGDFLADELYSDWCALDREYLRERFLTVLRHAARLHLGQGQVDAAVGCYRRALLADPTLEDVHRALMEALWHAGRRDEALRQYRECRAVLERELSTAPLPETEALRRQIIAERPAERAIQLPREK